MRGRKVEETAIDNHQFTQRVWLSYLELHFPAQLVFYFQLNDYDTLNDDDDDDDDDDDPKWLYPELLYMPERLHP